MKSNYCTILFYVVLATVPLQKPAAQNSVKHVTILVADAITGKPVEGAEVTFKALLGKTIKKTNSEGKAIFDMMLITETLNLNYTVICPNSSKTYKTYSGSISLIRAKDVYEYQASVQPNSRIVNFRISDDKRQPLSGAKVKLKDDKGNESEVKSDENGLANFDVLPGAQYKNALLTITKEGFNDYTIPVDINDQTSQVSVVAPLTAKTAIVDTDIDQPKEKKELPGPTENLINTSRPPGFWPVLRNSGPTWGPYTPACDGNPLASVPLYSPFAVEDEKTLLDNIGSSCFAAAGDAVNALIDLGENIVNVSSRLNAVWDQAFQNKDPKQTGEIPEKLGKLPAEIKKIAEEDRAKTSKSIYEAISKTTDLIEKMNQLTAGPEMYAVSCIWEGIQGYALPEPLIKLKKSTEAFGKARTAFLEKKEAIKKRLESGEELKYSDRELFTNWEDIIKNVQKTTSGLNLIVSYFNDPLKLLPYETQVNISVSTAEKMIGTLMTDCQIREVDRQIKQGITAGQALLTSARKRVAQMRKGEIKWQQIINDYVTNNFEKKNRGWELYEDDDYRILMLPQDAYNSWVNYHNDAIAAGNDTVRLADRLKKLGELCDKIQPLAATLNERVKKYEDLYTKGLIAVDACKLEEARNYIKQLQSLEKSECGHFYPKPFDKTKSEELDIKIKKAVQSGKCKETGIDPKLAGIWYECNGGFMITISGSDLYPALIWEQDLSLWEKPNTWRVKDPRIFSNIKVDGNKITGRFESNPEYEEYLPDYPLRKKKGKFTGTFEFEYGHTNYGPDDERDGLRGYCYYDSGIFEGAQKYFCFIRVKKW
jgi:hypothetical protein